MLFPLEASPEPLATMLLIGTGPEVVRLDVSRRDAQPEPPPFATRIVRAFTTNNIPDGPAGQPILADPLPLGRVPGLRWMQEAPAAVPEPVAVEGTAALPAGEIAGLRELSLRGDVAGIRRRLDTWRAMGGPAGAGEIVHRLEALVAAYDMEGIDDLLLTLPAHDGDN